MPHTSLMLAYPRPALLLCCTAAWTYLNPATAVVLHERLHGYNSFQSDRVAELPSGAKVTGGQVGSSTETRVVSFTGIKYAEAPRFEKPRLYEPKAGEVIEAQGTQPASCVQKGGLLYTGQEDCLTLNIFTPSLQGQRAVMVFLHGGFLVGGSPRALLPLTFTQSEDVVFVLPQYRLNVFGFLTPPENATGAEEMPLNLGLRDQIAALQWVQRNIRSFGGDPGKVTIMGQSAGGRSVLFLYNSPLASGLFQRAIVQSGGFVPAMGSKSSRKAAESLGKRCFENAHCTSVNCMKKLPIATLVEACHMYMDVSEFIGQDGSYFLGYDGEVLPQAIQAPLCDDAAPVANGAVPLMIGGMQRDWQMFEFMPGMSGQLMRERFTREFPQDAAEDMQRASLNSEQEGAALYSLSGPIGLPGHGFRYRYMADFAKGSAPPWLEQTSVLSSHGEDLCYLFDSGGPSCNKRTMLDSPVGQMLRSYWASFAKTGVPSSPTGPTWSPYDAKKGLASPWLLVDSAGAHMAEPPVALQETQRADIKRLCQAQESRASV